MRLHWNPDGHGRRAIPKDLQAFAIAKRREYVFNLVQSAAGGLVVGRTFAAAAGVPDALEPTTLAGVSVLLAGALLALGIGFSSLF